MSTLCAVFGCRNKILDKPLYLYQFPKVNMNAASDLKTQMLDSEQSSLMHYTELRFVIINLRMYEFVQLILKLVNILLEIVFTT